jgi:U1 small nuclear ribonucleoprotein
MHSLFSLGTFVPKIPPSDLGFVCKPELPPHINILFRARPPLRYLKLPHKGIHRNYTGIFDLANNENILSKFEKDPPENKEIKLPKHVIKIIDIIKKIEKQKEINKERAKSWNPKSNPKATGNPYKTLFVYNLPKNIDENILKNEFNDFGQIKEIRIIRNYKGVSKGYGFIEYEKMRDFRKALEKGNKKINDRHIYVEEERGRVDNKFKPIKYLGEDGKGRKMPEWLEEEIYKVKKKYPDIVKKAIESELNKDKKNEDVIINNNNNNSDAKGKKTELEMGEIEEDKYNTNINSYNKKKYEYQDEEDEYYLKKKRRNNRSPSDYSKHYNNSDYSNDSYHRSHSGKKRHSHKLKSNSRYSYEDKNYDKKRNKKDKKEGSEEGEID